jgi:hypothetical protein
MPSRALSAALLLLPLAAAAAPGGYEPERPWAIGVRAAGWRAGYTAPGLGGQIQWRPAARLGVEAFWNSFALPQGGLLLHDHVVGFHAFAPVAGGARWLLAPEAGLCVDFRFQSDLADAGPSSSDIRFGVHGGALAEVRLSSLFSVGLRGTAFGYWGNAAGVDGWSSTASPALAFSPVGQVTATLNVRP